MSWTTILVGLCKSHAFRNNPAIDGRNMFVALQMKTRTNPMISKGCACFLVRSFETPARVPFRKLVTDTPALSGVDVNKCFA